MRLRACLLGCITATVLAAAPANGAVSSDWRLSITGLGPIHTGMTVAQASARLGHALEIQSFNPPCGNVALSNRLRTYALTTGQRVRSITVYSPRIRTDRGVRIGDSVSSLLSRYPAGRLKEFPEFYSHQPAYAYVAGRRKFIYFTENGRVQYISTGYKPEVDYVEGCA